MGPGECCRTNDAMIYKSYNDYADTPEGCEAECFNTMGCRFFSHAKIHGNCVFCSACSLGNSRSYTSWQRNELPSLPKATPAEPLLFTMLDHGVPAVLATQRFPMAIHATPAWVHRVINLATPSTQRVGPLFNKFRAMAAWLKRHPEVDDGDQLPREPMASVVRPNLADPALSPWTRTDRGLLRRTGLRLGRLRRLPREIPEARARHGRGEGMRSACAYNHDELRY